jgi:hypothetical protein
LLIWVTRSSCNGKWNEEVTNQFPSGAGRNIDRQWQLKKILSENLVIRSFDTLAAQWMVEQEKY